MGKQLADIHGWLDDLAHGKRILRYEIICPSTLIGLAKNATLKDKTEREKLRDRWGTDPVHLTEAGYAALAEALTDSCSASEGGGKIEVPTSPMTPPSGGTESAEATGHWAASRWDSRAATAGRSRGLEHSGRQAVSPGRPGKRHRR